MRILIVEDEKPIAAFMQKGLEQDGHICTCAYDGIRAADMLEENCAWDMVLLDVMLPGADGFELMNMLAPMGVPVIFITARGSVEDKVKGLRLGADDYIVKPFEMVELKARIDAVMRRRGGSSILELGDVQLDTQAKKATRAGNDVTLTAREFALAEFLMHNRDCALFRETIYERVWGGEFNGDTRTVDLHITRLRKKLGWERRLRTLNRIGYRLDSNV